MTNPTTSFEEALTLFVAIPDDAMALPWTWRAGGPLQNIRGAMYRSLDAEQHAREAARPSSEAAAILTEAQRSFGDLRGLLIGLEDQIIDATPAPAEWTIRQTLNHMILTEVRYEAQVGWGRSRGDRDPVRIPEERLPSPTPVDTGSVALLLERLGQARHDTDDRHAGTSKDDLERPTVWGGFEVDLRFRLHRFAGHLIEHTIQCEKTLSVLSGFSESEARRIVRRISAMRGAHEHLSSLAALDELDQTVLGRARELVTTRDRLLA